MLEDLKQRHSSEELQIWDSLLRALPNPFKGRHLPPQQPPLLLSASTAQLNTQQQESQEKLIP